MRAVIDIRRPDARRLVNEIRRAEIDTEARSARGVTARLVELSAGEQQDLAGASAERPCRSGVEWRTLAWVDFRCAGVASLPADAQVHATGRPAIVIECLR